MYDPLAPKMIVPQRNLTATGWYGLGLGFVAILAFVALMAGLQHISESYHVSAIDLDDTKASLHGSLTFRCSARRIQYTLEYSVPQAETVTRLRLEYRSFVGPLPPNGIPLCQNPTMEPINSYNGPVCPSEALCQGKKCYAGTLSAAGENVLSIEYDECKRLKDSPTLYYLRLYTDLHPEGIAIADVTRHTTT
jgi:hypothetical protein